MKITVALIRAGFDADDVAALGDGIGGGMRWTEYDGGDGYLYLYWWPSLKLTAKQRAALVANEEDDEPEEVSA